VAAAVIGFVARGFLMSSSNTATATIAVPPSTAATPIPGRAVNQSPSDVAPIPTQIVLRNTSARSGSVLGDFNEWNPKSAPMVVSSDGAVWSVIIPVMPGRHLYGFMVDGSQFVLDPRWPKARDPDLGTEGSVILVGRP